MTVGAPMTNEHILFYRYLLRRELKVTTHAGRNSSRTSVLMVPASSGAKLNNIDAGNKLNSNF